MAHWASGKPVPGIYLYWIPLGAGGSGFVRLNGRIYESLTARRQRRRPLDLYHTALVVESPEGQFVVETMWPRPDHDGASRGVVREGPVFSGWLSFTRAFRYEVRCWRDGELPDADQAVDGGRLVSANTEMAQRALEMTREVPAHTWGRDVTANGDMWNSNSVVSWVLATSGLDMEAVVPPEGGRAPGWNAGVCAARRRAVSQSARNRDSSWIRGGFMSDDGKQRVRLPPRWFVRLAWSTHRGLYRATRGRFGLRRYKGNRWGMMRLTTIGRRSGHERSVILGYFEDGPNLVTMAMNGWADPEPAWWLNLQAHPQATVDLAQGRRQVRGRAAEGEDRSRLWSRWLEIDGTLDAYAALRSRETAVVVLEPSPDQ